MIRVSFGQAPSTTLSSRKLIRFFARQRPSHSRCLVQSCSFFSTQTSATSEKDATTAAKQLLLEDFGRHGFKLANLNPLHQDGFLAEPSIIEASLPDRMRPLVALLKESRQNGRSLDGTALMSALGYPNDTQQYLHECISSYCGNGIGWEVDHCQSQAERDFFEDAIHGRNTHLSSLTSPEWVYEQLLRAETFANLMSKRYSTARRFGLEGLEAAIPALNTIVNAFGDYNSLDGSSASFKRIILGTQHRGRLDFLVHVLQLPLSKLIPPWDVTEGPSYDDICAGYRSDITTTNNQNPVHIAMLPIPAHLEAMDAVVAGKARAHAQLRMRRTGTSGDFGDSSWIQATQQVLPLTVHGDASVCGQGVVSEALQLGTFENYDCGGSIRVIMNNQIGFTTETAKIRNRQHTLCQVSDVAHSISAPVLHVNAQHVQQVVQAAAIAVEYRQRFAKDIFLNLWGWRLHGHNELDDPHPTNVQLYQDVERQLPITETFHWTTTSTNDNEQAASKAKIKQLVQDEFESARKIPRAASWKRQSEEDHAGAIKPSLRPKAKIKTTAVDPDLLQQAAAKLTAVPDGFLLHPQVERVVQARKEVLLNGNGKVDWATAELLAMATLSLQGIHCRLSGEDVQRGTFCQRQAVWHDRESGKVHHPMVPEVQICNSPLSELGVLGFEYGYSVARPADSLVLWEAQFGDFVNGAQTIIDTVFSASDERWGMQSGLALLLPHGYDGMGPEHSSARLERWLQLFSSNLNQSSVASSPQHHDKRSSDSLLYKSANMIIAYPTEPSNYFHLLRRQLSWRFRRPLVVLTPKRTLRMGQATSNLSDFQIQPESGHALTFRPVINDPGKMGGSSGNVRAVILCSGELYYDLCGLRSNKDDIAKRLPEEVAIVRLEQLAPFPREELRAIMGMYSNATDIAWAQEEPSNQGARDFVLKHLQEEQVLASGKSPVSTFSRPEAAAPAVGHPREHHDSQCKLLNDIFHWSHEVCR